MNTAVISLGSNIEPGRNIAEARRRLREKFNILSESKFVATKPVGAAGQPDFLNGAVLLTTDLEKNTCQAVLRGIEASLGRKRSANKFAARTIDLDIVVWNKKIVDQDFYQRDFLKNSVLELIPDLKY